MKKYLLILLCVFTASLSAQNKIEVSGVVTSDSDKETLIGVAVSVKGTTLGTITDLDGAYTLANVPSDATLTFSMLGFISQDIKVAGKSQINVVMKEDNLMLDDVVVIGYGTVKKSDLTSSITSVKGEDLKSISTGNVVNALQGKASGVQITGEGGPGSVPRVIIRGVTTINGSDPLYVVDGVPINGNINFLNPNDIESMEVLKDASASAIYGTRGSNGVIIITTKKGKAGKTAFQFSSSIGFQHIDKPDIADASTYEKVFKERYTNDGNVPVWNEKSDLTKGKGTDWWDQTVKDAAIMQNYNLGFQGGNDKVVYSGSVGYFRQNSQFDVGFWERITARFNMEYTFSDQVKFGIDFAPKYEQWEDTPNIFGSIIAMDPTTPVYRPQSEWVSNEYNNYQRSYNNQTWNPAGTLARGSARSKEYGLITNPYISIEPIRGLVARSQFGVNARFRITDAFTPVFFIDALEQNENSKAERNSRDYVDWSWTNTVNYMKTFNDKHNLNLMGGFTMERYAQYYLMGSREGIPSNLPDLQYPNAGTMNPKANGTDYYSSLISYLGRVMYNYDGRYYLTASVRVDGSSRFPQGKKYATFPSASASWRISGEDFMKDQSVFTNLKLRAGWGRVGNQAIADGAYLNLIGSSDYVYGPDGNRFVGTSVSQIGNNSLVWETVEDVNLGLDMSFLDGRLDVTADWFSKKSKDMLMEKENLLVLGYPMWNGRMWTNIGSMKATGVELSLNWRDKFEQVNYEVGVNMTSVKNKATKLADDAPIYGGGFYNDYITRNEAGKEISRFYGYVADGIFQNQTEVNAHSSSTGALLQKDAKPGDIRFKDLNGDGVIDEKDKTYIGNAFPDLMIGFNLKLEYKGFDLLTNFYGTIGNDIYNSAKAGLYSGEGGQNVLSNAYSKAWRGEGSTNTYPRLSVNDANGNYRTVSTFFVEDGSYFRCKLLQIGYKLPRTLTKDTDIRVSLSAQNLFTITNYSGMDPERAAGGSVLQSGIDNLGYPNPRTFLFGLNINF